MWCQEILRVHHSIQVGDKANGKYCWMVCNSALSISIETKDRRQVHWIWLCKGNGLHNKSILLGRNWEDKGLSVASSIDGAFLSKNLSIVAGGIKTDLATQCPLTKRPLLDNPATMCVQSRNLCLLLKIMMGWETKETFTEFGPLFKFLDDLSDATTIPDVMAGFCPFLWMTICSLSAQ